jgi:hypothetical protein
MKLSGQDLGLSGEELKAYLIQKPEEIQNNQFGGKRVNG